MDPQHCQKIKKIKLSTSFFHLYKIFFLTQPLSWMRRPDYISTEQTRYQPTTIEKIESDIGYTVRKKMNVDELYMDRDNQIKAIEKTFEDALEPIEKHYSKGHVYPVDVMSILPDSQMWKYPCAQVMFCLLLIVDARDLGSVRKKKFSSWFLCNVPRIN